MRPRSVACVHKLWLTPRMQHTRVPQTVRRDWRLAIETSSIPSFHIFRSWTRNQIECRIEDRKKPNGPNRKSNRLIKKTNSTYLVPRWIFYLGWLMWCNVCTSFEPSYENNIAAEIQFAVRYFRPNESVFAKFVQHQSALPYMGCCTLSTCSSNKGLRILGPTIQ